MSASEPKPNPWTRRLRAELRRDMKKSALLVVLLAAGGIVAGRLVVTHRVPKPAAAAPPGAEAPRATARAADAGRPGPAAGDPQGGDERVRYLAGLDRTIRRDLFRANLECFAPLAGQDDCPEESGWFGGVYRRLAGAQDPGAGEAARVAAVREQARELRLESTMLTPAPVALINGQVLRVGDRVGGFRVRRIAWDRCVLSKDGVDVELRLEE